MGKPTALGVYIFAGGFTVGVSRHFKVRAHLEDGDFGVATAKLNFPRLPIFTDPQSWPTDELEGTDFVYCNPPCAPWSATGRSSRMGYESWKTDPRVSCVHNAFRVLEEVRPKVWVWESVTRAYTAGRDLVDALTKRAHKLGYAVTYFLTDAQLHGLPQRRQRFHFVAHRVALDFPEPKRKIVTVKQALRGVKKAWSPQVHPHTLKIMKNMRDGEGMADTFNRLYPKPKKNKRGQVLGRPTWMNFRIDPDKPTSTLIGACHAVHPTEHRFITPLEQAALCGYPRDFKWAGKPLSWYPQVSRAVTPVIGDYLARVAKRGITRGEKVKPKTTLVVDFRKLVNITEGAR